jgi:ribonuclease HI
MTLQLLKQNHKRHTHIIDQIKNKVMDMERDEFKVEFNWVTAHAGQRGHELADGQAKEASSS